MEESTKEVTVDVQEMLANATGPLEYGLTNDYLFKAFLQKNQRVLRALVASLLHMEEDEIADITIQNPIKIGSAIKGKANVLDMLLELNGNRFVNLEMQVARQEFWTDRALVYTARTFDNLEEGQMYDEVKPVHHIGILDFDLFAEDNEFYATYMMLNEKTHRVFSDKIKISVLNLRKIEYATKDDSDYMIDYWAKVFKAKSWEELKMLAEKSEVMQEGIVTLRELTADEEVRMQMWAREDHNRIIRTYEHRIEGLETEVAQKDAELEQKDAEIERLKALLEQAKE